MSGHQQSQTRDPRSQPSRAFQQQQYGQQQQMHPQDYYQQQMIYQQYYMQQQHYYATQYQHQPYQSYPPQQAQHPQNHGNYQQQQYGAPHYQTQYRFTQQHSETRNHLGKDRNHKFQDSPRKQRSSINANRPTTPKNMESDSEDSCSDEDEERKTKINPIMDSPEEIRKWVESRRRNYPTKKRIQQKLQQQQQEEEAGQPAINELSQLEIKLRKQIQLSSCSGRSIEMKARNLDIIRNIITEPVRRTKPIRKHTNIPQRTVRHDKEHPARSATKQQEDELMEAVKEQDEPIEAPLAVQSKPAFNRIQAMILSLKARREDERQATQCMFNYRENSSNYHYMKNTLTANLVLEDVFKENCYLLQAIRYIVKHDFLEKQEELPEIPPSEHSQHSSQDELVELQPTLPEDDEPEQGEFLQ